MITKLTITFALFVFLFVVWFLEFKPKPKEGHNICLGPEAGMEITDESYQFRLRTDPNGPELATTMTHEEIYKHKLENITSGYDCVSIDFEDPNK